MPDYLVIGLTLSSFLPAVKGIDLPCCRHHRRLRRHRRRPGRGAPLPPPAPHPLRIPSPLPRTMPSPGGLDVCCYHRPDVTHGTGMNEEFE